MKLHLAARPPHEAARRIARWVFGLPGGLAEASRSLRLGEDRIQRLIAGEIVPGYDLGRRLQRRAAVEARHFHTPPVAGWSDQAEAA